MSVHVGRESLRLMLIFSFRYALDRQTGASEEVRAMIRSYGDVLTPEDCAQMARDIEQASARPNGLGHPRIDRPEWLRFADWVRTVPPVRTPEVTA